MPIWDCPICGNVYEGKKVPIACPSCGAGSARLIKREGDEPAESTHMQSGPSGAANIPAAPGGAPAAPAAPAAPPAP